MIGTVEVQAYRTPNYDIDPLFVERWSPRSFSGEPITDEQILRLAEAARWSPSAFNNQPWRFLYARRDSEHWETYLDLLNNGNHEWAQNASALVLLVSKTTHDVNGKYVSSHSLDAGAAWLAFALQAARDGLGAHPMLGFDAEGARAKLGIPDEYHVEIMIALGPTGNGDTLTAHNRTREQPNGRRPLEEIVWSGLFRDT